MEIEYYPSYTLEILVLLFIVLIIVLIFFVWKKFFGFKDKKPSDW
jgi:F0F1-type ATP synthase membrane subunit b/b'